MEFLYRGVHAGHPARASALNGVVVPGDINGTVSPMEHNIEDQSELSPYTSWTSNIDVARGFANSAGPGGVLLRVSTGSPGSRDAWSWEYSPDEWGEDEMLLRGVRIDAEVMEP